MNLPLEFQLIIRVPDPDNTPFAALAARCDEKNILSVDYLPAGCLEKATVVGPKSQVVEKLEHHLRAYFKDPEESVHFKELPLCYSALAENIKDSKPPLRLDECRQVLEKVRGKGVCAYSEVANRPAAKVIGQICSVSPFAIVIPCYRIVRKNQDKDNPIKLCLGEFKGNRYVRWETGQAEEIGRKIKRWLLQHEGTKVIKPDNGADKMSDWLVCPKSS